jgi:hypothetical protein
MGDRRSAIVLNHKDTKSTKKNSNTQAEKKMNRRGAENAEQTGDSYTHSQRPLHDKRMTTCFPDRKKALAKAQRRKDAKELQL